MMELRWKRIKGSSVGPFLQYRYIQPCVDASGALCPGEWTKWKGVSSYVVLLEDANKDE